MRKKYNLKKIVALVMCLFGLAFMLTACTFTDGSETYLNPIKERNLTGGKRLVADSLDFTIEFFDEGDSYMFVGGEIFCVETNIDWMRQRFFVYDKNNPSRKWEDALIKFRYEHPIKKTLWKSIASLFKKDDEPLTEILFILFKDSDKFGWSANGKVETLCHIEDIDVNTFLPIRYTYDIWESNGGYGLSISDQCTLKTEEETSYAVVNGERVPIRFEWNGDYTFAAYFIDGGELALRGAYTNTYKHTVLNVDEDNLFGGASTILLDAVRYTAEK
ncbi:MAG: hypothetical protein LBP62_01880 [Clostridiales bacterium]|jgi:hypothetical protein|nr:hypothetical protein [Clostridiales bacterium]